MIHLNLITLSGRHLDQEIYELMVPTTAGTIAINQGHAPLLGAVAPGILSIRHKQSDSDASREQVGVYNGTVEVLNNTISLLVDEIDTPDNVVEHDAQAALKRAQELKAKAGDAVSLADAQTMMDRQAVRLQLAGLKKSSKKRY
ncbi:MAG: ATP synthase F1 subunit epsilon [Candidatus Saccharimonadales bacterium]